MTTTSPSVSSYNSKASVGVAHGLAARAAEAEAGESLEQSETFQTAVFGVMFTIGKDKLDCMWQVAVVKLIVDWIQLFTIIVEPSMGWDIQRGGVWWIVDWANVFPFLQSLGFTFYMAILYLMVAIIVIALLLSVWVAVSFKNKTHMRVWPVVLLRLFVGIFVQGLFISVLNLLEIGISCQVWGPTPSAQFTVLAFPSQQCSGMIMFINIAVSAGALLVFLAIAVVVALTDMEMNPLSKRIFAHTHAGVELISVLLKYHMTMVIVFIGYPIPQAFMLMFASIILYYVHIQWEPFAYPIVNHVRCGMYLSIVYVSITYCALTVDTSSYVVITKIMYIGIVPTMVVGALLSWLRLSLFTRDVLKKFKLAEPGSHVLDIYEFDDPREVEILMRCCRSYIKLDVVDPAAVARAEEVVKAGLMLFPKNSFMLMMYSNFLIEVQGALQSGYTQLQVAKKANPSFMVKYAIFYREQLHTQQTGKEKNGQTGVDLISYVEFQRNQRLVIQAHKEALIAIRFFWQLLTRSQVPFTALSRALHKIDSSVIRAEKIYKLVLDQYPTTARIVKLYAMFLEDVKNDPGTAAQYFAEVETLEENTEDEHLGEGIEGADEAIAAAEEEVSVGKSNSVIVINSIGVIQMINKVMCATFGFQKASDLKGKNVSLIIPPPFAQHHDTYVKNYIRTGHEHIINTTREWIALHRERYVFPVRLTVSKVSGTGEDSVFMGVIQVINPRLHEAKVWTLSSGIIVSTDMQFGDWFGFRPEDVIGKSIVGLAVDPTIITSILESETTRKAMLEQRVSLVERKIVSQNSVSVRVALRHKYTDPVDCAVEMSLGGGDKIKLCIFTFQRTTASEQMMVTDSRGQCIYTTSSLAEELGYKAHDIKNVHISELITQPYSLLHQRGMLQDSDTTPPTWSCRAGAPVMLITARGRKRVPAKLTVKSSSVTGELLHIIYVRLLSADELADDRRLHMLVNHDGIVTWVGNSPSSLFGFKPELLIGRPLALCVDAFRMAENENRLEEFVKDLASRSLETPGDSFRVNVMPPFEPEDIHALGSLADKLIAQVIKAAVMTVGDPVGRNSEAFKLIDTMLSDDESEPSVMEFEKEQVVLPMQVPFPQRAQPTIDDLLLEDSDELPVLLNEESAQVAPSGSQTQVREPASVSSPSAGSPRKSVGLKVSVDQSPGSLTGVIRTSEPASFSKSKKNATVAIMEPTSQTFVAAKHRMSSAMAEPWEPAQPAAAPVRSQVDKRAWRTPVVGKEFEVSLWRTDMLSAALEVDKDGLIAKVDDSPTMQPGLIFGIRNEMLMGRHLQTLIGWPGPVSGLLRKEGGKRGALKMAEGNSSKIGPLHVLNAKFGNGGHLKVAVQAIGYEGFRRGMSVMVRVAEAVCGSDEAGCALIQNHKTPGTRRFSFQTGGQLAQGGRQSTYSSADVTNLFRGPGALNSDQGAILSRATSNRLGGAGSGGLSRGPSQRISTNSAVARTQSLNTGDNVRSIPSLQDALLLDAPPPVNVDPSAKEGNPPLARQGSQVSFKKGQTPPTQRMLSPQLPTPPKLEEDAELVELMDLQSLPDAAEEQPARASTPSGENDKSEGSAGGSVANLEELGHDEVMGFSKAVSPLGSLRSSDDMPSRGAPLSAVNERMAAWAVEKKVTPPLMVEHRPTLELTDDANDEEEPPQVMKHTFAKAPADLPHAPFQKPVAAESVAAAKDDGGGDSPEYAASEVSSGGDEGSHQLNYRRAKRFKKLLRHLSQTTVSAWMRRLRVQSLVCSFLLLLVHVVCFIVILIYLQNQTNTVTAIYNAADILTDVEKMNFLLRQVQQGLAGVNGGKYGYGPVLSVLFMSQLSPTLVSLHQSLYLSGQSNPTMYALWNDPVHLETTTYNVVPTPITTYANISLWDLGNNYMSNLNDLIANYQLYGANMGYSASFLYVIQNGPFSLHPGYEGILNQLILEGTSSANIVDLLEVIILAVEVGAVCTVVTAYVWWLLSKVSYQRYTLYSIFLCIPNGLIRTLASKSIALNSDSSDDSDDNGGKMHEQDAFGGADANADNAPETPSHATNFTINKVIITSQANRISGSNQSNDGISGWFRSVFNRSGKIAPENASGKHSSSRRALIYNAYENIWLISPFFMWIACVVTINIMCFIWVGGIGEQLGPFMSSASFQAASTRMIFLGQEMCTAATGSAYQLQMHALLNKSLTYTMANYDLLLYGTLPDPSVGYPWTDLQYKELDYADSTVQQIMIATGGCLRLPPVPCVTPGQPFYLSSTLGLDSMVRRSFYETANMLQAAYTQLGPNFSSLQYFLFITLVDVEDGLLTLRLTLTNELNSNYTLATELQIILFVMSFVGMFIFLVFLLRPYVQRINKESYRIAELLSQLPTDIDVEKLVSTVLQRSRDAKDPKKPKVQKRTGSMEERGQGSGDQKAQQTAPLRLGSRNRDLD